MKNILKKIISVVLIMALTSIFFMGTSIETKANIRFIYYSDPWNGTGSSTMVIEKISTDRFKRLTYGNEEIANIHYSIKEKEGNTFITLSQEYLQSLNLKNGGNYFEAEFSGSKAVPWVGYMLQDGENEITIERELNEVVDKVTLSKPMLEEEDVYESNYTVTTTDENIVITFDEEYLQSIEGQKGFWIYTIRDEVVDLMIVKGEIGDVDANGKVSLEDAQTVLKMALKIEGFNGLEYKLADTDDDNDITLADAQTILKKALKIN